MSIGPLGGCPFVEILGGLSCGEQGPAGPTGPEGPAGEAGVDPTWSAVVRAVMFEKTGIPDGAGEFRHEPFIDKLVDAAQDYPPNWTVTVGGSSTGTQLTDQAGGVWRLYNPSTNWESNILQWSGAPWFVGAASGEKYAAAIRWKALRPGLDVLTGIWAGLVNPAGTDFLMAGLHEATSQTKWTKRNGGTIAATTRDWDDGVWMTLLVWSDGADQVIEIGDENGANFVELARYTGASSSGGGWVPWVVMDKGDVYVDDVAGLWESVD